MGRIRTVKPEFWSDEDLSEQPTETHMLAAALLNHADDEGYFNANPKLVKAVCCPLREDSVSVHESLNLLSKIGYLRLLRGSDGKQYGVIVNFTKHQRVNRPTASKIKPLLVVEVDSLNPHGVITDDSSPERKGTGKGTGKGKDQNISVDPADEGRQSPERASPPPDPKPKTERLGSRLPDDWALPDEWRDWAIGESLQPVRVQAEADKFRDYWRGVPGAKGRKADWAATWRNWIRKAMENTGGNHAAHQQDTRSRAKRVADKLDEIAQRDILANGFTSRVG